MKKWFLIITTVALLLAYSNCGQMNARSLASRVISLKAEKSLAVASKNQVLVSYARCLGLSDEQLRSTTISTFKQAESSFSGTGTAQTVSAPMMMSAITVASEVCVDLITAETPKASRFYLRGFNLGGSAVLEKYDLEYTIQSFATSCWSRAASVGEIELLTQSLKDAGLAGAKNRAEALFICTNILASSDALKR